MKIRNTAVLLFSIWSALFLCTTQPAFSQLTEIEIGAVSPYTSVYTPFYGFYPSCRSQMIYWNTELNTALQAAGLPTGGAFIYGMSYYSPYGYGPTNVTDYDANVHLAHTNVWKMDWTNNPHIFMTPPDYQSVFDTKTWNVNSSANAWSHFSFDRPFIWNGTDNLLVDVCADHHGSVGYGTHYYPYWSYYDAGYNYPPYITGAMYYGTTSACSTPNAGFNNGWTYYKNRIKFDICTGPASTVDFDIPSTVYLPNTLPISYSVGHATGTFTATITFNVYTPSGTLVHTESISVPVAANTATGVFNLTIAGLTPGFYRLEAVFNTRNQCGTLSDRFVNKAVMVLTPGQNPCLVWPGDANNDLIVNYADRKTLNQYIHDANLNPVWLNGPARYQADYATNPMTYLEWKEQPSVPWGTPDGCYNDTDGNGLVNALDNIAIKLNWMKTHGAYAPKGGDAFSPITFDMDQNFPNPFNPTTNINYSLPERSVVRLQVFDMLGRLVTTLADGTFEPGVRTVEFNATDFNSGSYIATISMTGVESGLTFNKTMKMTLNK